MRAEPGDRDVPRDSAAVVEQLGVDDTPNRPGDQIARDTFEQRQRARTVQLDLPERCHVDDPHPFAERAVLLCLQLEPWRPGPAEAPLVCACPPPGPVRLEVLGPFPAMFLSEDRTQVLDPVVQGARPARPAPLVGVERVALKVVIAVGLARQLGGVSMISMDRTETPGTVAIQIELCLPGSNQLRERPADATGPAESV